MNARRKFLTMLGLGDVAAPVMAKAAQEGTGLGYVTTGAGSAHNHLIPLNGRTIGNAASGACERANRDTVHLYAFLWQFRANKAIELPDYRPNNYFLKS